MGIGECLDTERSRSPYEAVKDVLYRGDYIGPNDGQGAKPTQKQKYNTPEGLLNNVQANPTLTSKQLRKDDHR